MPKRKSETAVAVSSKKSKTTSADKQGRKDDIVKQKSGKTPKKTSDAEKKSPQGKKTKNETKKKSHPKLIEEKDNKETETLEFTAKLPTRNKKNELVFEDHPEFRPNRTPKEVLQAGSFGGTYFQPIKSSVTDKSYSSVWMELPKDWLEGLSIAKQVSSATYDAGINTYGAKCGGSLQMWEESGWIHKQDPYGWFQWYCRFYQGRRTGDDPRQIGRWARCAGETGRWRNNLISKCVRSGCGFDNHGISPVVRQTLQHWGYTLTKDHFDVYAKKMKNK